MQRLYRKGTEIDQQLTTTEIIMTTKNYDLTEFVSLASTLTDEQELMKQGILTDSDTGKK